MAETTPGPLIMVVQFVGFLAGYREPGGLDPITAATVAAILTTWVTFVPCFLWIFLGAPFIELLRANKALTGALSAITGAVVGVIANLALWFAMHTLFREVVELNVVGLTLDVPVWQSLDVPALVLALVAIVAVFWAKSSMFVVLGGCALIGVTWSVLGG
jgi:chromate transporter